MDTTRHQTTRLLFLLLALVGGLLPLTALAAPASAAEPSQSQSQAPDHCTIHWDGGGGSASWHNPANWTEDRLPTSADHACITAAAAGNEVVHHEPATITSVGRLTAENWIVVSGGTFHLIGPSASVATRVNGGRLHIDNTFDVTDADHDSGIISGAGAFRVTGFLRWVGGIQEGPGWTGVWKDPTMGGPDGWGGLAVNGPGPRTAINRQVIAHGGMLWEDGGSITLSNSILNLNDVSGVTGSAAIHGNGLVSVDGQLLVQDGGLDLDTRLDTTADGIVDVSGVNSRIVVKGGGVHTGLLHIGSGAWIDFAAGNHVLADGSTLSGDMVEVTGANVDVKGEYAAASTEVEAGHIRFVAGSNAGNLLVSGGLVDIAGDTEANDMAQDGGEVTGGGVLHVSGRFHWGKGTQSGTGNTDVEGPFEFWGANATRTLKNRWLTVMNAAWHDSGELVIEGEGQLSAGGTFATGAGIDSKISGNGVIEAAEIKVDGDARLIVEARYQSQQSDKITIAGANSVLSLAGGGEHNGTATANGGLLSLPGTHRFTPESNITMTGGAAFGIPEEGLVTIQGEADLDAISNSGYLGIDHSIAANSVANWGHIDVTLDDRLTIKNDGTYINVAGGSTALVTDTSTIDAGNGTVVNNGDFTGAGLIIGTVENNGTLAPFGDLIVAGRYQQAQQGELFIAPGDELAVDGDAVLAGNLTIDVNGDYPTAPFVVLDATTRTGEFHAVTGEGLCAQTDYTDTQVVVTPQPCAIVWDGGVTESDGEPATFAIDLTEPAAHDVVITYSTRDDTAVAGTDYTAAAGTVTIPAGQTEGAITVTVTNDEDAEPTEHFIVDLSAAGAMLDNSTAKGTIADDDEEETPLEFELRRIPVVGIDSNVTGNNGKLVVGYQDFPYEDDSAGWGYRVGDGYTQQLWGMHHAWGINNLGQMVGECDTLRACYRENATNYPMDEPNNWSSTPVGINEHGEVVGTVTVPTGPNTAESHPIYWPALDAPGQQFQGLPGETFAAAIDINDFGLATGYSVVSGVTRSWVWTAPGGITEIPALEGFPNTKAEAVNDDGTVVGMAWDDTTTRAWKWTLDGGTVDMGPGGAFDINDGGDIVGLSGIHATLWRKDQKINLNDKVKNNTGYLVHIARSISDDGVIAAEAWKGADKAIVVLGPEGTGCAICLSTKVEAQQYPNPDAWISTGNQTTDGNLERLTAAVKNNGTSEKRVKVEFTVNDLRVGELHDVTLAPGEATNATALWDTTGLAWKVGSPAPPYTIVAAVYDATNNLIVKRTTEMTVNPKPAILVHGLWSDESTWASYPEFLKAAHPGWKAFAVDTLDTSSFVPNLISENAGELRQYIDNVQRGENAWQVDIVAHSMGGLISRYYIQKFMPERGGKTAVANLMMLGTPNGGSPCAYIAAVPATYELRPNVVADFNEEITETRGIPRSVAVGHHLPFTCGWPSPGDDVVPIDSAIVGMNDYDTFEIAHTSMTGSSDLFTSFVLPRLNGMVPVPPPAMTESTLSAAADSAAASTEGEHAPQLLTAFTDPLAPGATTSVTFTVPAGAAELGALAVGPGALRVELVHNGNVVADSGTSNDPNRSFRVARLDAPTAGMHTVRVTNTGLTAVDSVPVRAWANGLATKLEATAEQVGPTGVLKVTAQVTGAPLPEYPSGMLADITSPTGETLTYSLQNQGGGVYSFTDGGYAPGVYEIVVRSDDSRFDRLTTTAVRIETGEDIPGQNDAPIALDAEQFVPRDTPTGFALDAVDPEGEPLNYEIVQQPAHGQLEHYNGHVTYFPNTGFQGTDTFTFRANDTQAWSNVATVTVNVGPAPSEIRYLSPVPAEAPKGSVFKPAVKLVGPLLEPVDGAEVTFELGGHQATTVTSSGWASVSLPLDMAPGTHVLKVTFDGNENYLPSELVWHVVVTAGVPPNPSLGGSYEGEAGYPILASGVSNDPDADARYYDFDFQDDGVFDVRVEHQSEFAQIISAEWTYPDAFDGLIRLRVTDTAGNVGEATAPVHIKPHRPLGDLNRVMIDGEPVRLVDTSADGRYVLYEVTDTESNHQLPTPFGVLDRTTGAHQIVSILPNGTQSDRPMEGVISKDGRWVAFSHGEYVGQTFTSQTYVRDVLLGTTVIASVNNSGQRVLGASHPEAISDGGRSLLFGAWGRGLTEHETYNCGTSGQTKEPCDEQYIRDLTAGTTTLVSANADGLPIDGELGGDMTADGKYAVFNSRGKVVLWERGVPGVVTLLASTAANNFELSEDGNHVLFDDGAVRRLDRASGQTTTLAANGGFADMTACGNYVAYYSRGEVFLLDVAAGTHRKISVEARDGTPADKGSWFPRISDDGKVVYFDSDATNLVPGDINAFRDLFVLQTGVTDCGGEEPPPNTPPVVALTGPASMAEGASVPMTAVASDADGDELTYAWSTSVGSVTGEGAAATLSVADGPATANVTVTVSDGEATVSATHAVTVDNVVPVVVAGDDVTVPWGQPVTLTGTVSDVDPWTAAWSFGDGSSANGVSAEHAWSAPGTYTATLTGTDKDGGVGVDTVTVTVVKHPVALSLGSLNGPYGTASVTATVTDAGSPLAGRPVSFVIDGGQPVVVVTDGAGVARLTALPMGQHQVSASVAEDDWYLGATAAAVTVVVEATPGKVTGTVGVGGGTGSFTAQSDKRRLKGDLTWTDGSGVLRSASLTSLGIAADSKSAWLSGTSADGRSFTLYLEDNGESGRGDVFKLWVDGVLRTGDGVLTTGNVQVHRD